MFQPINFNTAYGFETRDIFMVPSIVHDSMEGILVHLKKKCFLEEEFYSSLKYKKINHEY